MDSRSQPSKSVVAPLVRGPSCTASAAARRTCQIHRPAQHSLPCFACLLALANTALSLHLQSVCQSSPFPRSVSAGAWTGNCGLRRHRLRRPATGSDRVQCRSGKGIVVKWIYNARTGYCEGRGENGEYYKRVQTRSHFIPPSAIPAASHRRHKRKRWPREPPTASRERRSLVAVARILHPGHHHMQIHLAASHPPMTRGQQQRTERCPLGGMFGITV